MTPQEMVDKFNIPIKNKEYFEKLTEEEQLEVIGMYLAINKKLLKVFIELNQEGNKNENNIIKTKIRK